MGDLKADAKVESLLKGDLRRKILQTRGQIYTGDRYEIKGRKYKGRCDGRYPHGVLFSYPDNTREFLSWAEAAVRVKYV